MVGDGLRNPDSYESAGFKCHEILLQDGSIILKVTQLNQEEKEFYEF